MLPTIKCHQKWNVTKNEMSPKMKCYQKWNVTQNEMSQKNKITYQLEHACMQGIHFVACMANIFYTIRNLNNKKVAWNIIWLSWNNHDSSAFLNNSHPHDKIQLVAKIWSPWPNLTMSQNLKPITNISYLYQLDMWPNLSFDYKYN